MDMAHYPELHQKGVDDNPEHGRCLSSLCHLREHLDMLQLDPTWKNIRAVELRSQQLFQSGLHHRKLYETQPELLDMDRREIVQVIESRGLDPREFILNLGNPEEII